jgi:hypothetical protein
LVWLYLKDRRFLKKRVRDILSEEMRKSVNLPTNQDQFPKNLNGVQQKQRTSQEILKKMNET